jgi:hypothetical protein
MDAIFLILDEGYAGGAADCIEKIQCPAGFVSAHAQWPMGFMSGAIYRRRRLELHDVSLSAGVATTHVHSGIEIYQCMSRCICYPITVKAPDIIRIAAWRDAAASGRDYGW